MKYRKTFTKAFEEVKSRNLKEQEEQTEFSKDDVEKLKDEITQLKLQLQQAKNKTSAPVPNKDTGEIPLQTGIGHAILRLKDKEEKDKVKAKQASKKIEKLAKESLVKNVIDVMKESEASDKAKSLGLDYLKFGRYGKDGKVTHKSIGGTLTAVDKNEKPIKEPKKDKPDEPKDKGAAAGEPDKEQQVRDTKKELLDIISDDDFDPEEDLFDDNQHKVLDKLRKLGDDDTANEFESIGAAFNEMDDDAEERLDDFIDRLKGKTPATETAIKNFEKVKSAYEDQNYEDIGIEDFKKDTINYLKSLSKVLDAGEGYTDTVAGNMKTGALRKDQIEVLQDGLEELKGKIEEAELELSGEKSQLGDSDPLLLDIEYLLDPLSDHDNYTKGGKVSGTLEDIINQVKKLDASDYSASNPKYSEEQVEFKEEDEEDKKIRLKDIVKKAAKKKIKLDNGKSKIEIDPEAKIGQHSGGTTVDTGNLH